MKAVPIIIGYRRKCYHCGESIQLVLIPQLSDHWQSAETVEKGDTVVQLHDCPKHPSKPQDEEE
jgi:hypothetical protein